MQYRHRLTGWNAVKSRVEQLKLDMTDDQVRFLHRKYWKARAEHSSQHQIKDATAKIKELADVRTQSMEDVDTVLRVYHSGIVSGQLSVGESHILDKLLEQHLAKA
jgi:homocitrate synthase